MIRKIVPIIIFSLLALNAVSQVVGYLPDDSKIVRGTLRNGMTYYLVKNSVSTGFADFSFVQKTGIAMETSQTVGMTYLMECMALTETKNFPDGEFFTFLDNMGLVEKDEFRIDAGDYHTAYSFLNVPLKKNALVVDSMLMALYNISSGIIINETTLERGKQFFKNVFSANMGLDRRTRDSIARFFYAGTPLAPISDEELFRTIDGYTVKDVQRFYSRRSRADMQAIVISGDIDVASITSKLNTLFQLVPKPSGEIPKFVKPDRDSVMNGFFYVRDVEADCATVEIDFLVDEIAPSLRTTAVPLVYDYMSQLAMNIMQRRLRRNLESASFFALGVDAQIVPYLHRNSFRFSIKCAPQDYTEAYRFMLAEIRRMADYGISEEELEMEKNRFFFYLSRLFENRAALGNGHYTAMCVEHFVRQYSMVGVEWYKTYIEAADAGIDAEKVGGFIADIITDVDNRVVTCISPEPVGGLEDIVAEALPMPAADTSAVVRAKPEEPRKSNFFKLFNEKFVNRKTGVTSRRLSNGTTVAFKPLKSEPGWVYFEAVARGGLSLSPTGLAQFSEFVDDVARISIVGGKNAFEQEQDKQSRYVELSRNISVEDRKIVGKFHRKYLDEFMEMVSMYFGGSEPDEANFEKFRRMKTECAPYENNSPEKYFDRLHSRDILVKGVDSSAVHSIETPDYLKVLEFVNTLFENVAEFSFIFVGDIDESELMASVNRYISPLPGRYATAYKAQESSKFFIASYDRNEIVRVPMSFPRAYHSYKLTFPSELNMESRALTEITAKAIEREVIRQLSIYGILATSSHRFYRYPKEVITIDFQFTTATYYPELENLFADIITRLADLGVSANEVGSIRQNIMLKEQLREVSDHGYWKRILRNRYVDRKDFYTKRNDALNAVNANRVNDLLKQILETGRLARLSVVPDENTSEE